ncbi:ATP-binding protein [Streptobacillus canis]|uniref:ATP-binding protein n=1 Tax=Streptobacillus canis TaxID=2678686 RepID=UPI0012E13FE3|nr:ATP-binding protein [Streptobacillus canis]
MHIERDIYLNRLIRKMDNGLIKVITGIRRSGKSYFLFKIFKKYLKSIGVEDSNIISIQLDLFENKEYRKPGKILEYIYSNISKDGKTYILIDEIQMLEDFEDVLNSLLHKDNLDIYVTGSNSMFLSHDILTKFRGRGDRLHIYPLSFKEFMSVYPKDMYQGFSEYLNYGGLPLVLRMETKEEKMNYLISLFQETYIKDIYERHRIERKEELNDLINILASNIGTLTNPSKIEATFRSVINSKISNLTIGTYIEYLQNAFLITAVNRYDVKGRKYIGTPLKYYFEDLGLRNARLNFRQFEQTHLMENVIYNELRLRGYLVDVGVVEKRYYEGEKYKKKYLEVDFIATLGDKKIYIQSAYSMPNLEKIEQESASLKNINDSFKKIIIVKDVVETYINDYGIITMSLFDFLLNEDSLDI